MPKRKRLNYELIEQFDDKRTKTLSPEYELLREIKNAHHPHLFEARIALAWRKETSADADGLLVLGKCKKVGDLEKEFHDWDFIIILNRPAWEHFTDAQRAALIDHELSHAAVVIGQKEGRLKRDGKGRIVYRIRKHDIEEFGDVVARHGLYKSDLERFFRALKAEDAAPLFGKGDSGIAGKVGS